MSLKERQTPVRAYSWQFPEANHKPFSETADMAPIHNFFRDLSIAQQVFTIRRLQFNVTS